MAGTFEALAFPDKLNLGCGWDIRDGFLNVDIHEYHKPQLVADVTDLAMLPGGHYVEIVAQDVLEHLPRQGTVDVLREWNRLLRPGGTIELRVPNVVGIVNLMQTPEFQTIPQQELMVQSLFGTQAYTEDCHYTTFTEPLLRHYLAQADFEPVEFTVRDGWLFEVVARKLESGTTPSIDPFGTVTTQSPPGLPESVGTHPPDRFTPPVPSPVSTMSGRALQLIRRVLGRGRGRAQTQR